MTVSGATTGCSAVTLTANDGAAYLWDGGDTPDDRTNTFHQSGTYRITAFNNEGYSSTVTLTVTVNAVPITPPLRISANPAGAICSGTPVGFTVSPLSSGPAAPTFQWLKNGLPVASGPNYDAAGLQDQDLITCQTVSADPCAVPAVVSSNAIRGLSTNNLSCG